MWFFVLFSRSCIFSRRFLFSYFLASTFSKEFTTFCLVPTIQHQRIRKYGAAKRWKFVTTDITGEEFQRHYSKIEMVQLRNTQTEERNGIWRNLREYITHWWRYNPELMNRATEKMMHRIFKLLSRQLFRSQSRSLHQNRVDGGGGWKPWLRARTHTNHFQWKMMVDRMQHPVVVFCANMMAHALESIYI